uniref:Leishmanolysin-like peptidase n=1 Tax=Macrostomum lignano TaxID=282301 RepID=A0A1I8IL97_9PLAT
MAVRLSTPSLLPLLPVSRSVALQLLLLCLCCCVRWAKPLTDANWPQLSIQKVFDNAGLSSEQDYLLRETVRVAASRLEALLRGTECSQQWMVRRPVAGLLRVCPRLIDSELASRSGRLLQQILAGLVRMLGFSRNLMTEFQRLMKSSPSELGTWETLQERDILVRQNGISFVRTASVQSFAERHFNCSIGVPLAPGTNSGAWHPVFMFPSVLSSAPVSTGVSCLDEGTLALLEDSGWYTVNYSLADRFSWGRRAGCWFSWSCPTSGPSQSNSMFCSADAESSSASRPDHSHKSVGSCGVISNSNCSAVLPRDTELCNLTGNWRSLQIRSQNRSWTECLSVACPAEPDASDASYAVTRNGFQVTCLSDSFKSRPAQVEFGDGVQLICVHISLVCPRQSSVLDLLSGFPWQQGAVGSTVSIAETASSGTIEIGISKSDSDTTTIDRIPSTGAGSASTTGGAKNSISTTASTVPPSSMETTPNPTVKFTIKFEKMDYYQLVDKALIKDFKVLLQKALAEAFRISIYQISVIEVKPGSVIANWENSDPSMDASSKLNLIRTKVNSGAFVVTVDGVEYSATSVEYYTGESNESSFPLMEVVIGSVVGGLLLIGFILVIVLVTMKHKLNRPRMQVRPRSEDTTPTTSSQTSRQCSAATSGVVQLATLGGAGVAPSARAVADVESTQEGGRRGQGGRGGRGRGAIIGEQRGVSAGSVGLQFSDSELYFEI